eukprot:5229901-Lingulodinium_polyedra.AAC.1
MALAMQAGYSAAMRVHGMPHGDCPSSRMCRLPLRLQVPSWRRQRRQSAAVSSGATLPKSNRVRLRQRLPYMHWSSTRAWHAGRAWSC